MYWCSGTISRSGVWQILARTWAKVYVDLTDMQSVAMTDMRQNLEYASLRIFGCHFAKGERSLGSKKHAIYG
jgi:hypothetical protein